MMLASLCGRLLHAASVIRAGWLLINCLLTAKRLAASMKSYTAVLDAAAKADISWWIKDLSLRNRIHFLDQKSNLVLGMDASSSGWEFNQPGLTGFNYSTGEYWQGPPI